jgi:protein SCO1/2
MVLNGVLKALRVTPLNVYEDFDIVTISINPRETIDTASEKKGYYVGKYNRPNAEKGWHFLTGSKASIDAMAQAIGFTYVYDEASKQYAHAAGTVFLTPKGVVSRYLFGIEYVPRDIRLALVEASQNKIGNPIDKLLLYCFQYDPAEGKYGLLVMNVLRLAGLFTVLLLAGALLIMLYKERKTRLASVSSVASSTAAETGVGKK